MDKKKLLQIAVVVTVILFLLQTFGMGGIPNLFRPGGNGGSDIETSGKTVFNATIRTYEPVLVLPADAGQSIIDELNAREDVEDVTVEQEGIVVKTETRDDVYPLASYLRTKGITSVSQANIILPQTIEVALPTGLEEVYMPSGFLPIITEPVIDAGNQVTIEMTAVVKNGVVVNYHSAEILLDKTSILLDATATNLNYKLFSYEIPWEERNSLDLGAYTDYDFNKKDSMLFTTPLTIEQIMAKKQFQYVEYIDANSAQMSSDFDNITELETNFQDVNYTLPSSYLTIKTNETPDIGFDSTVSYNYDFQIDPESTEYLFTDTALTAEMDEELEIDSAVQLNASIVAADMNVISVGEITVAE